MKGVTVEPKKVIGLMSGTSCDSIDAALCEVQPDLSCKLIRGINFNYPENLRAQIIQAGEANAADICKLNFEIGKYFADAANVLISEFGKPDLIASHGQTVYHIPGKSTLQIGESAVIAEQTGCLTVSNFREADIAAGGQGAPLVCFADEKWFSKASLVKGGCRDSGGGILVQNIGGIANVTVVGEEITGYDTGPGNMIIDYCMQKFFNLPYDKDGAVAASGKVDESWLECLLSDEYYFLPPPKTTGREYFSAQYVENILKTAGTNEPKDIIATVTALTAKSIAQSYERFGGDVKTVIVGGGGAYNPTLLKFLRSYLPSHLPLKTHEDYGISNNFKEAMAFALLGYCTYYGIPNNVPSCTGASRRVVLGKLTPARS